MRRTVAVLKAYPAFFALWSGQTVSAFGSAITSLALPLAAVTLLGATPLQMGILAGLRYLPHLLLGLPVGVWVDRWPRRPVLLLTDLGQALLLGSLPALALLNGLRIEALYIVAVLTGLLALLADVAGSAYLPTLVARTHLLAANSATALSQSVATTLGPALAGLLVQLLSAPLAIALDALSFVASAGLIRRIPSVEPATDRRGRRSFRTELTDGLRVIVDDPVLRAMIGTAAIGALAGALQQAVLVMFLVRELGLSPAWLGIVFAANGLAAIGGALVVSPLTERLGPGRAWVVGQVAWALATLVLAVVTGPFAMVVTLLIIAQLLGGAAATVVRVNQLTTRQALVPDQLLGRINASRRVVVFGIIPLGSLLGGVLGQSLGLRSALGTGALIMGLAVLWLVRSPVPRLAMAQLEHSRDVPVG